MFFLPDETYKHIGKTFTITFGKPISYKSFDKTKSTKEWAAEIRQKVYELIN